MESTFMKTFQDKSDESEFVHQKSLSFLDPSQSTLLSPRIEHMLPEVEVKLKAIVQDKTYRQIERGIMDTIEDLSEESLSYLSPEQSPKLLSDEASFSAKKKKKNKKHKLVRKLYENPQKLHKKKENLVKSLREEFLNQVPTNKDTVPCDRKTEDKLLEQSLKKLQDEIDLKTEEICSKNIELYKKDLEILNLQAQLLPPKNKSLSETFSVSIPTSPQKKNSKEQLLRETLDNKTKHIESLIEQNSLLQLEINFLSKNRDPTQTENELWELTKENNRLHKQVYDLEAVEILQLKIISVNTIEKLEEKVEKYKERLSEFQTVHKNYSYEYERRMKELNDEISGHKREIKALKEAIEETESVSDDHYIIKYFEFNGLEWMFITDGHTGKWVQKHKVNKKLAQKLEEDFEATIFKDLYQGYHHYKQQIHNIKEMVYSKPNFEHFQAIVNDIIEKQPVKTFNEVSIAKDFIIIQKENNELHKKVGRMEEVISHKAQEIYDLKCKVETRDKFIEKVKFANILLKKLKISATEANSKTILNLIEGVQSILEDNIAINTTK